MTGYTGSSIEHLNITATNLAFYDAVLPVVGVQQLLDVPAAGDRPAMVGYGRDPKPFLWLVDGHTADPNLHLAFTVDSRADVDAFYTAALAAGATSPHQPAVQPGLLRRRRQRPRRHQPRSRLPPAVIKIV